MVIVYYGSIYNNGLHSKELSPNKPIAFFKKIYLVNMSLFINPYNKMILNLD